MKRLLQVLFTGIILAMLALTTVASFDRGVFDASIGLWPDPWFRATLADAYFGFVTVWLWVAWRERTWTIRLIWLVLFFALGNLAIATYVLLALRRVGGVDGLFQRREPVPER